MMSNLGLCPLLKVTLKCSRWKRSEGREPEARVEASMSSILSSGKGTQNLTICGKMPMPWGTLLMLLLPIRQVPDAERLCDDFLGVLLAHL